MDEMKRRHIMTALAIAIAHTSAYERGVLKFTGDSAQVAAWKQILKELEQQ
jgi:hypothetical protein